MDSKLAIIKSLIETGESFDYHNFCYPSEVSREYAGSDKPEWLEWKTRVSNFVEKEMADSSPASALVKKASLIKTRGNGAKKFQQAQSTFLKALKNTEDAINMDVYGELNKTGSTNNSPALSNKIFIVHGHDTQLKNDVERFLHEIGLEPIVLHRQADNGNTVIEKFEKHSDVGYAFILLTPDEIAFTADQEKTPDSERKKEFRARPNVIFEFGYFVGKLGRSRVCCLHRGNTAIPSDLAGLVYKSIQDSIDSQAYSIIKELKSAGYSISV